MLSPPRVTTGPTFSATVSTLKAGGSVKRLATEKTSNGPQKSSTSTSSKIRIARVRVAIGRRPFDFRSVPCCPAHRQGRCGGFDPVKYIDMRQRVGRDGRGPPAGTTDCTDEDRAVVGR